MANTKVTGDVIANGTISTVHIADDAITAAKLDSTATGITFADLAVSGNSTLTGNVGIGGSTITDVNLLNLQGSSATKNIGIVFNDTNTSKIFGIQNGGSSLKFFDYTASTERMRIDSSGNLTLQNGAVTLNKSDGIYLDLRHNNSTRGYLGIANQIITGGSTSDLALTATTNLVFGTGGTTERMRITSSGNVGIGETSPLGKLHIKGSDTGATASAQGNSLVLEDSENGLSILSSTAGAGYINFGDSDNNNVGMIIYGHSSNSMDFWTNAGKKMTINSSGNVGIGTASPTSIASGYTSVTTNGTNGGGLVMQVNGTATGYLYTESGALVLTNTSGVIQFYNTGSERMRIDSTGNVGIGTTATSLARLNVYDTTAGQGASRVVDISNSIDANINIWLSQSGASTKYAEIASYSTIPLVLNNTSGGNVGIGETSPDFKLHVKDTQTSDTAKLQLRLEGNSGNYYDLGRNYQTGFFEIQGNQTGYNNIILAPDSGNVGIGTASPGYKLDVTNVGADAINVNASNDFTGIRWSSNQHTYSWRVGSDNFFIYDVVNSAQRVTLNASGNVGIGTTNPQYAKLQVNDSIRIDDDAAGAGSDTHLSGPNLYLGSTNGGATFQYNASYGLDLWQYSTGGSWTQRVRFTRDGNVGIGTTSPNAKLSIQAAGADGLQLEPDTNDNSNSARLFWRASTGAWAIMNKFSKFQY